MKGPKAGQRRSRMHYLSDIQEDLFNEFKKVKDGKWEGDEWKREIERHMMLNEMAKTMIANGALMARCADTLYGLPVAAELPLIPPSPAEKPVIVDGKRRHLLDIPKTERVRPRNA